MEARASTFSDQPAAPTVTYPHAAPPVRAERPAEPRMESTGGVGTVTTYIRPDSFESHFAEPSDPKSAQHKTWRFFKSLWEKYPNAVFPEGFNPVDAAGYQQRRQAWAEARNASLLRQHREDFEDLKIRCQRANADPPQDIAPDFESTISAHVFAVLKLDTRFAKRREWFDQAKLLEKVIDETQASLLDASQEYTAIIQCPAGSRLDLDRAATLLASEKIISQRLTWLKGERDGLIRDAEGLEASIRNDATTEITEYLRQFKGLQKWDARWYVDSAFHDAEGE